MIALIGRMAAENRTWGATRIHGELRKLGVEIAQSTVSKYLRRYRDNPTPRWKLFIDTHAHEIAAVDMLTVKTAGLETIYAVVVMSIERRSILHVDAVDRPGAAWLAQQVTEAFAWDQAPRFLIRDNDGAYGERFRWRLKAMGVRDRPITPHSPWQNGWVERLISSIRRECLDHLIILDAAHLRRVLRTYADHYNNDRTHLALGKDAPNSRKVERAGRVVSRPILGGLHHRYYRITER